MYQSARLGGVYEYVYPKRPEMTVVAVTHDPNFEAIAERIVDFREINKTPVEQVFIGSSAS